MKRSDKHILKFSGLKDGLHEFSYSLNEEFFKNFNYSEFNSGKFNISVKLSKKPTILELNFTSKGLINVNCSISNESFNHDLLSKLDLVVNFGEDYDDTNDELLILPFGSHSIDLDQYFYEMIVLSVPLKLVHPGVKDGSLDSEIVNRLKEFDINQEKSINFDPRWNKLKELKK